MLKKAKHISKFINSSFMDEEIDEPTLNVILEYLEDFGKIAILKEGIIWIYKEDISKKLREKLRRGITVM